MQHDGHTIVRRDVDAVQIPFGNRITLRKGMELTLRQPLAGWQSVPGGADAGVDDAAASTAQPRQDATEAGDAQTSHGATDAGAADTGHGVTDAGDPRTGHATTDAGGADTGASTRASPGRPAPAPGDAGAIIAITAEGFLVRVEARDADALGLERTAGGAPAAGPPVDEQRVWEVLRTCYDPEIPVDIVALGLVYGVRVTPGAGGAHVEVKMTLTAPGCSMAGLLKDDIEQKLNALPGVGAAWVELVFDPPWDPSRMSDAARLQLGFF